MKSSNDLNQHFRPEETLFIERLQDMIRRVEDTYSIVLTEFFNPRQIQIARSVIRHSGLSVYISSDYVSSEYARIILAPDYYQLDLTDFEIELLEISYNSKFNQLTHAQIMGTLINHLGIKRTVFGDIRTREGLAQIFVDRQLQSHFTSIGKIARASVNFKVLSWDQAFPIEKSGKEQDILVSSMRLDKIVSTVFKIQRSQALRLIEAEKVKVNYALVSRPSEMLRIGDLVSVRGYGRFSLEDDKGLSKQGKHKLIVF
ncbi:YlmH family RNA-binding protein [Streptococcus caprae]|uniref:RNA-binding protein n=1 Tax=Streptococcus caprae TaxID=1640501 RepID=A0ABV8CVI5_9STRE